MTNGENSLGSIIPSLIFGLVYFLVSIFISLRALKKNWKIFSKLIFGSMIIRIVATLLFVWIGIEFLGYAITEFVISLFIMVFLSLVVEAVILSSAAKKDKKPVR